MTSSLYTLYSQARELKKVKHDSSLSLSHEQKPLRSRIGNFQDLPLFDTT